MVLFLEAFALGVVVAAPLGPVGATVVRTGLLRGFAPALAIGVGAAVVDGVYFVAAAAGASQAFRTAWLGVPLWLGGTAFLAYLGFSGLTGATRTPQEAESTSYSIPVAFGHGLLITMLNPLTIASWLAVAGSLAVSTEETWSLLAASAIHRTGQHGLVRVPIGGGGLGPAIGGRRSLAMERHGGKRPHSGLCR